MKLVIASALVAAIKAHAESAAPDEACGLLVGDPGHARSAVRAPNVAAAPERNFEIDPATLLRVHREARGTGQAVIGHYHSHPGGIAQPSRTDAARAVVDGQVWLVVAGDSVTGWIMAPGGFVAVELR